MNIRIGNTCSRKPANANPITLGIIFALVGGAIFFLFALPPLSLATKNGFISIAEILKAAGAE